MGPYPMALQLHDERSPDGVAGSQVSPDSRKAKHDSSWPRAQASSMSDINTDLGPVSDICKVLQFMADDNLRGLNLSYVMRCFGRILSDRVSSEEAYSRSCALDDQDHEVYHDDDELPLEGFVSHSWTATRLHRFHSFVMYYQSPMAFLCCGIVFCIVLFASLLDADFLPAPKNLLDLYPEIFATSCLKASEECRTLDLFVQVGTPLCLFFMFFYHDAILCLGSKAREHIFLAKACVQRETPEQWRSYYKQVPALMHKSKTLLIIYNESYLREAGAVFELTMFLTVQPTGRVIVLGIWSKLMFAGTFVSYIATQVPRYTVYINDHFLGSSFDRASVILYAIIGAALVWSFFVVWMFVEVHRNLRQRFVINERTMSSFRLSETHFRNEYEKEAIEETIIKVMRSFGYVSASADSAKVLRAFNHLVRNHVPMALEARTSRVGVPYRFAMLISQSMLWFYLDQLIPVLSSLSSITKGKEVFLQFLIILTLSFAVSPLAIALVVKAARHSLGTTGVATWALGFMTSVAMISTYGLCLFVMQVLQDVASGGHGDDSWKQNSALIALLVFLALLCFHTYQNFRLITKPTALAANLARNA